MKEIEQFLADPDSGRLLLKSYYIGNPHTLGVDCWIQIYSDLSSTGNADFLLVELSFVKNGVCSKVALDRNNNTLYLDHGTSWNDAGLFKPYTLNRCEYPMSEEQFFQLSTVDDFGIIEYQDVLYCESISNILEEAFHNHWGDLNAKLSGC